MESLRIAFNVIFPLFLMMCAGYLLRLCRVTDETGLLKMNALVFRLFLPVMVFKNIIDTDIVRNFDAPLVLFAIASVLILFTFLMLVVPRFEKDRSRRGVIIQAVFRSNFVIFGIPITAGLFGEGNTGTTTLLIAVVVPLYTALAVIALEINRGEKIRPLSLIKNVLTNPVMIATFIGIAVLLSGIKLPAAVGSAVGALAKATTPLALVVLGGLFHFSSVKANLKPLLAALSGRLIFVALVFIPAAALLFGFRSEALAALLILFAAPVSVTSFTMADQLGGDSELAAQMVIFSSALSVVTIFLWIFALKSLGWL